MKNEHSVEADRLQIGDATIWALHHSLMVLLVKEGSVCPVIKIPESLCPEELHEHGSGHVRRLVYCSCWVVYGTRHASKENKI
jgi:hypothetical protein